jgi:citrate synthase
MSAAPAATPTFSKGLVGVIAAQTELSSVDGQNGVLTYRGINIHDLAGVASYEEVAYLLLFGKLPNAQELKDFQHELGRYRELPQAVLDHVRSAPREATPMDVLRTAASSLAYYDPETEDLAMEASQRKAIRLIAQFPSIVGAIHRRREGKDPVPPRSDLGHAAHFLYLLHGEPQSDLENQAMNLYLVLLADHSLNASTFTARVAASTNADLHSAVTAALGALKGNLHGGAAEATMNMLLEIGSLGNVDPFVDRAFETKRKIMGIGHRIYKTGDPRARHLLEWARRMEEAQGQGATASSTRTSTSSRRPCCTTLAFQPRWIPASSPCRVLSAGAPTSSSSTATQRSSAPVRTTSARRTNPTSRSKSATRPVPRATGGEVPVYL